MNDLMIVSSIDPSTNLLRLSLPITPQGLLMTVSGRQRMIQRVLRWMITPLGSLPYDPLFGNQLFDILGTTVSRSQLQWTAWVHQTEYAFIQRQIVDIKNNFLTADESVAGFSNIAIAFPTPFTVQIMFDVTSQAGVATQLAAPIIFNTNG